MKKYALVLLIINCFLFSCEKNKSYYNENMFACGVSNPQKNIRWLKELIEKAEVDKTGNYLGTIWLEKYAGEDVFVIDMALGSGGVAYYCYDCKGTSFVPQSPLEMKKDKLIYTNLPL